MISELNSRPTLPLSTLHVQPHDCPRMTRGHDGAAIPFMWGSFIPYSMPVYPGAFRTSPLLPFLTIPDFPSCPTLISSGALWSRIHLSNKSVETSDIDFPQKPPPFFHMPWRLRKLYNCKTLRKNSCHVSEMFSRYK